MRFGAAMANRVGDGFAQQMLKVELKPDRDRASSLSRWTPAVDRPMLAEPLGERRSSSTASASSSVAVAAKRRDEAADVGLFLDQQPLELLELGLDAAPGPARA